MCDRQHARTLGFRLDRPDGKLALGYFVYRRAEKRLQHGKALQKDAEVFQIAAVCEVVDSLCCAGFLPGLLTEHARKDGRKLFEHLGSDDKFPSVLVSIAGAGIIYVNNFVGHGDRGSRSPRRKTRPRRSGITFLWYLAELDSASRVVF